MSVTPEKLAELQNLCQDCRKTAQTLAKRAKVNPDLWQSYYNAEGELCPPPAAMIGNLRELPRQAAQRLGIKLPR